MIRVAVIGASGRMGSEVCRVVEEDGELDLVARVDSGTDLSAVTEADAEVAVEFTTPDAVMTNVRFCLRNGVHVVVGTTGIGDEDLREIETLAGDSANAFVAPNFAVGAVLMMQFAATAARHFDRAEIIERHHERKLDAPSGTALRTARLMNEARGRAWPASPDERESLRGSRGGDESGVRIHSVRTPGSVAHQEVVLGGTGETLSIRHDSLDRASFMPGVLLAVKRVPEMQGLTVGLEHLLDLG